MTHPAASSPPKVAIVYDRANIQYGGAEYLLKVMAKAFPSAPLLTSVSHRQATWQKDFARVYTTFLQKIPFAQKHHQWFLPFMPLAFESLNLDPYDIVISFSSAEAKGVLTKPHQLHIAYLFAPPRYLYHLDENYQQTSTWRKLPIIKQMVKLILAYLKWWDLSASLRPDILVTLSLQTAQKIEQVYGRETQAIVYPPVQKYQTDPQLFRQLPVLSEFYLCVARLVEYKRLDLAIRATLKLKRQLIIVGTGLDLHRLQRMSGDQCWTRPSDMNFQTAVAYLHQHQPDICFMGNLQTQELAWLYSKARALLSPGIDDFGLVPLEAAQFGLSSIIHAQSGAAEILTSDLATHLKKQDIEAMLKSICRHDNYQVSPDKLMSLAQQFSSEVFIQRMTKLVYDEWRLHNKRMNYDK